MGSSGGVPGTGSSPTSPTTPNRAPFTPPTLLLSAASQARQCYNFQHIYFGPFDLNGMKFHNVSCPHGCSEAVLSLDTGEGQEVAQKEQGVEAETGMRD